MTIFLLNQKEFKIFYGIEIDHYIYRLQIFISICQNGRFW